MRTSENPVFQAVEWIESWRLERRLPRSAGGGCLRRPGRGTVMVVVMAMPAFAAPGKGPANPCETGDIPSSPPDVGAAPPSPTPEAPPGTSASQPEPIQSRGKTPLTGPTDRGSCAH